MGVAVLQVTSVTGHYQGVDKSTAMGKDKAEKRSRKDSDSSNTSVEDDAPKAKASKSTSSSNVKRNDEGDQYIPIERNKRITVREFKGKVYVDIREYYEKDGKSLPGKKGIALSASQYGILKDVIPDIDEMLKEIRG